MLKMQWKDFPGGPVSKTPNAGGPGWIPGQGTTRSHVPQLKVRMLQIKIPRAAAKTWRSQINK